MGKYRKTADINIWPFYILTPKYIIPICTCTHTPTSYYHIHTSYIFLLKNDTENDWQTVMKP